MCALEHTHQDMLRTMLLGFFSFSILQWAQSNNHLYF
ncbi:hypothetical protein ACJIZ3_005755 [Penstemon smallii]|uniref:Uncharacterized protein n=1 Tax=Penstemon smallii TaxID=265156 RepID=A0ABD3S613_9LAMI